MRKLVPLKNSVVCKRLNKKIELQTIGNLQIKKENVDLYEILDIVSDDPIDFKVGDVIMSCSSGDEIEINDNEIIYLFKNEHIMCKIHP
jgi:co-chaperonin GroES (HSP10)